MADDVTSDVGGGLNEPDRLQPEQGALALASPEDVWSRADWEKAAAGVLRKAGRLSGDDPDDEVWAALTRTTYDGVAVAPLGTPDLLEGLDLSPRPTRTGDWDVRTRHIGDNAGAVADLEGGATSLWLVCDTVALDGLAGSLDGVLLDLAPVVLEAPTLAHAEALCALGPLHPDSNLGATSAEDSGAFARLAVDAGVRAVVVDGTVPHEAGASDAQELGWLLARGAEVLRALDAEGISPERAFGLVELRVAATVEQFPTIAKLRAIRRLWARLAELCGVADPRTRVHAVTSRPMTSAYDVHVNLLRGTVAAFAAGVGGADAITVVPFDEPTGEVSTLGRRMARNVNALLMAESHVAAVTDPAGGGYAIEKLTDDLCRAAWAELGRIEVEGWPAYDERVAEVRVRREADVATRRRPITGLSEFPHVADPVPARRNTSYRYGAAFEGLRREMLDEPVYLAVMGSRAESGDTSAFMGTLFAAGGVHVELGEPAADVEALVEENDGQPVVCLVGTDAAYDAWGEEAAEAMRRCGADRVIVAGAAYAWADDSFRRGDDAVAFLTRTREALR